MLGLTALIMDYWKGDNQYEKPGIIRKKASCPFWFNWQVVLEPTSPSFANLGQRSNLKKTRTFHSKKSPKSRKAYISQFLYRDLGSLTNLKNELNYIILIRYPENQIPRVLSGARFVSPRRLSEPERRLHRQSFRHSSFMSHDFTFNQPDQSIGRCFAF